jgi:hypothetical protein
LALKPLSSALIRREEVVSHQSSALVVAEALTAVQVEEVDSR